LVNAANEESSVLWRASREDTLNTCVRVTISPKR